jgi:hypothetical protein
VQPQDELADLTGADVGPVLVDDAGGQHGHRLSAAGIRAGPPGAVGGIHDRPRVRDHPGDRFLHVAPLWWSNSAPHGCPVVPDV